MVDSAALGPDAPVPPGLQVRPGDWLLGFHGTVAPHGLDPQPSLRVLATSHLSLGLQSMSVLTDLPSLRLRRLSPRGDRGAGHVGAMEPTNSGSATDSATPTDFDPWDEQQPLSDYLDRKLLRARTLLLPNRSRSYRAVKRAMDVVGASLALLVFLPVLLLLAVIIRLDSPGPAIFKQQRVTLGGRVFTFYKFRTMWVDAKERFPELYEYHRTGPLGEIYYKLEDDPRNTRVGRWLRRTTLDELPNLWNVLLGDMSLVGPRPELPQLIPHYRPEDLALFFTKAGLTGLAQVTGRSLLTVHERITLDLRYVAQQTLLLDVRILIRTVLVVLLRRGAF